MEGSISRWANIATILAFVLFVVLTLIDRWSAIAKWGELSMLLKISFVILILGVIFAGIAFYFSKNKGRSKPVRIIKNPKGYHYLVEGNSCFHIPDPETLNYLGSYLGFSWSDAKEMLPDEISRRFTIGKALPSIRLHFPKTEH